MNRVDAAVIHDLRKAALEFQQRTLLTMFTTSPAAGPGAKRAEQDPTGNTQDTHTKGLTP